MDTSNKKKYKLSKNSLFMSLISSFLIPLTLSFAFFYVDIVFVNNQDFIENITLPAIIVLILLIGVPALYVLIEHLFFVNKKIIIDIKDELITFERKGNTYTNSFSNVEECVIYKETKGVYFISSSLFSVCYITFIDGVEEKISCLAEWDLHRLLGRIKYTEQRTVFPSILLYDFLRSLN